LTPSKQLTERAVGNKIGSIADVGEINTTPGAERENEFTTLESGDRLVKTIGNGDKAAVKGLARVLGDVGKYTGRLLDVANIENERVARGLKPRSTKIITRNVATDEQAMKMRMPA